MHNIVTLSPTKEARCFIISALMTPYVSGNLCGDAECECEEVELEVQNWFRHKMCLRVLRMGVRGGFQWLRGLPLLESDVDSESDSDSEAEQNPNADPQPILYSMPNMKVRLRDGDPPPWFRYLNVCQPMYNSVFHVNKKTHALYRQEAPITLSPQTPSPQCHCLAQT